MKKFPIFENNQVLSSVQLNELTSYLESEERETRTKLIGAGIACGLTISREIDGSAFSITEGVGVTSDGYLVDVPGQTFSHYKAVADADELQKYSHLTGATLPSNQVFEVFTESGEGTFPMVLPILSGKIVVLFLDIVKQDINACIGQNCAEKGKDTNFIVRILLVNKDHFNSLNSSISGLVNHLTLTEEKDETTTKIEMPRVLLSQSTSLQNFTELFTAYDDTINSAQDNFITDLFGQVSTSFIGLDSESEYTARITVVKDMLVDMYTDVAKRKGFQYVYDYLKDIVQAYNEYLLAGCDNIDCKHVTDFQQHLLLGVFDASNYQASIDNQAFRHRFVQAQPVRDHKEQDHKDTLHRRLYLIIDRIEEYILSGVTNATLKVTPSVDYTNELNNKAIPFYLTSGTGTRGNIEDYWHLDNSCITKGDQYYFSNNLEDPYSIPAKANAKAHPLQYDFSAKDFFRIEGHITGGAKAENDASSAKIDTYITNYNLPFNVVKTKLGASFNTYESYPQVFSTLENKLNVIKNGFAQDITELKNYFIIPNLAIPAPNDNRTAWSEQNISNSPFVNDLDRYGIMRYATQDNAHVITRERGAVMLAGAKFISALNKISIG
ncbi:MAG: hypothetical protein JKY54_14835, partial [Flavobacteriales bacterium]|nr:hypothetical protein [Flavobacteriales bacterium]